MASLGAKRPKRIGKMRERVIIYSLVRTEDSIGGFSTAAPVPLPDPVWAEVITLSAHEQWKYEQIDKRISHVVRVRYLSSYSRGQTVVWGTRTLYVDGVVDLEQRKEFLELSCTEGTNP